MPGYSVSARTLDAFGFHARWPRGFRSSLDIAWAFKVPPDGAPRDGTTGDVFMVAYWYPQLAVYDDVTGGRSTRTSATPSSTWGTPTTT